MVTPTSNKTGWPVITSQNDWGSGTDQLDGKPLVEGQMLVIEWPNGYVTACVIAVKKTEGSGMDHGHSYHWEQHNAVVRENYNGVPYEIPIAGLPAVRATVSVEK